MSGIDILRQLARSTLGRCRRLAARERYTGALRALEQLEKREQIGALMANACFNLAQPSTTLDESRRDTLKELYRQWDAAGPAGRA